MNDIKNICKIRLLFGRVCFFLFLIAFSIVDGAQSQTNLEDPIKIKKNIAK
jgi:hypothetical protein